VCCCGPPLLILVGYFVGVYAIVYGVVGLARRKIRLVSFSRLTLRGWTAVVFSLASIVAGAWLMYWLTAMVLTYPEGLGH
jgi:hypothetical protein